MHVIKYLDLAFGAAYCSFEFFSDAGTRMGFHFQSIAPSVRFPLSFLGGIMKAFCILFTLLGATSLWAQSSSSTSVFGGTSASESPQGGMTLKLPAENPKLEDDHQITDNKLKAEQGSLSKYSLKTSLSYNGPPIGDLSNSNQPNPDGTIGNSSTAIGGSVSGRYRFNRETAMSLGTGINALTPFQGVSRFDVRTPTLTYERVFRVDDWQFRNAPGVSVVTVPEYIKVGEFASLNYDASAYRYLGTSGFRAGTDVSFGYYLYNRNYEDADKKAYQYTLSFYPGVKYSATDKLSISTSLSVSFANPREVKNQSVMLNKTLSQRLGLEYSITREIFIAPYLNFYPKSLHANSTTINVSTIFSVL